MPGDNVGRDAWCIAKFHEHVKRSRRQLLNVLPLRRALPLFDRFGLLREEAGLATFFEVLRMPRNLQKGTGKLRATISAVDEPGDGLARLYRALEATILLFSKIQAAARRLSANCRSTASIRSGPGTVPCACVPSSSIRRSSTSAGLASVVVEIHTDIYSETPLQYPGKSNPLVPATSSRARAAKGRERRIQRACPRRPHQAPGPAWRFLRPCPPTVTVRAAEYVRMSTDHQKYSTDNQSQAIRQYAAQRGIEVVRTYADEGKSGVSLQGRDALKQPIYDVENKTANFTTILVYDVSRWGRFQDVDESAYYEYVCRRAGINVQYCAESFQNDDTPISAIVKSMKRWMAGEYSRESLRQSLRWSLPLSSSLDFTKAVAQDMEFAAGWSISPEPSRPSLSRASASPFRPTA